MEHAAKGSPFFRKGSRAFRLWCLFQVVASFFLLAFVVVSLVILHSLQNQFDYRTLLGFLSRPWVMMIGAVFVLVSSLHALVFTLCIRTEHPIFTGRSERARKLNRAYAIGFLLFLVLLFNAMAVVGMVKA